MNFEEEIAYRNELLSQARNGKKLSAQDRLWLVTHPLFNRSLGYPATNADIINLNSNAQYSIRVRVECKAYSDRIIPVFSVPGGKGIILVKGPLTDIRGNASTNKPVKVLGLLADLQHNDIQFFYQSELGLLGVSYECDYLDTKQHIMIRKNSGTGDPNFAMLSETLTENKRLYRCKSPDNDSFESLVFSLEWNPVPSNP